MNIREIMKKISEHRYMMNIYEFLKNEKNITGELEAEIELYNPTDKTIKYTITVVPYDTKTGYILGEVKSEEVTLKPKEKKLVVVKYDIKKILKQYASLGELYIGLKITVLYNGHVVKHINTKTLLTIELSGAKALKNPIELLDVSAKLGKFAGHRAIYVTYTVKNNLPMEVWLYFGVSLVPEGYISTFEQTEKEVSEAFQTVSFLGILPQSLVLGEKIGLESLEQSLVNSKVASFPEGFVGYPVPANTTKKVTIPFFIDAFKPSLLPEKTYVVFGIVRNKKLGVNLYKEDGTIKIPGEKPYIEVPPSTFKITFNKELKELDVTFSFIPRNFNAHNVKITVSIPEYKLTDTAYFREVPNGVIKTVTFKFPIPESVIKELAYMCPIFHIDINITTQEGVTYSKSIRYTLK